MSYNSNKQLTHKRKLAVEVMASSPQINQEQLAKDLGICRKTISNHCRQA